MHISIMGMGLGAVQPLEFIPSHDQHPIFAIMELM
jgi:hypothetical protein